MAARLVVPVVAVPEHHVDDRVQIVGEEDPEPRPRSGSRPASWGQDTGRRLPAGAGGAGADCRATPRGRTLFCSPSAGTFLLSRTPEDRCGPSPQKLRHSAAPGTSSTPRARCSAGMATEVARLLRGKHKPICAPNLDAGDHVVVVNAAKLDVSTRKADRQAVLPPLRLPRRPHPALPRAAARPQPRATSSRLAVPRDAAEGPPRPRRCSRSSGSTPARATRTRAQQPESFELAAARRSHRLGRPRRHRVPKPLIQTTGRRKEAVARVRLRPGTGKITVQRPRLRGRTSRPSRTAWSRPSRCGSPQTAERLRRRRHACTAAASAARPARCGSASPGRSSRSTPRLRPVAEEGRPAHPRRAPRRSARSTASRRRARRRSTPSGRRVGAAALRFGTDGIRGVANVELTPELRGVALGPRPRARVRSPGRRSSSAATRARPGPMLEAALVAGLARRGRRRRCSLGVVPTPAVAFAQPRERGVPAAMISARHNPFPDNGIKLFAPGGRKLPDDARGRGRGASSRRARRRARSPRRRGPATASASPAAAPSSSTRYVAHARRPRSGAAPRRPARGRRLRQRRRVELAPARAAGARAPRSRSSTPRPTARNINAGCGSTHPERAAGGGRRARRRRRPRVRRRRRPGASRSTQRGRLVDGDQILAHLRDRPRTTRGALRRRHASSVDGHVEPRAAPRAWPSAGISVVETPVGDRHVLDRDGGRTASSLGGEQSGHVIFARPRDHGRRPARPASCCSTSIGALGRGRSPSWPRWS